MSHLIVHCNFSIGGTVRTDRYTAGCPLRASEPSLCIVCIARGTSMEDERPGHGGCFCIADRTHVFSLFIALDRRDIVESGPGYRRGWLKPQELQSAAKRSGRSAGLGWALACLRPPLLSSLSRRPPPSPGPGGHCPGLLILPGTISTSSFLERGIVWLSLSG